MQQEKIKNHLSNLNIQGLLHSIVSVNFSKAYIKDWSEFADMLPETLFRFQNSNGNAAITANSRKFASMGKSSSNKRILCDGIQTNKHVLSCCKLDVVLARFKNRHDRIIASWLSNKLGSTTKLFVDLDNTTFQPLSDISSIRLRPDIAIESGSSIVTLELTHYLSRNKHCSF